MKEVVRRWKLLRKVLLRAQNSKMVAGWNKWLEVYRIMRARSQRHIWVRIGDELFKRTGLGVFKEVLRRWKLLRRTLLRCANSKLASGWNKWREVVLNIGWVRNRRVWILFAEFVFKKTGVGLMREMVRRWKLLRRTLMRAANSKLAAGWTTWKNDMLEARRAKWIKLADKLKKTVGVDLMKEVLRRWKLLRKTLLRMASIYQAAGFDRWIEVLAYLPLARRKRTCRCKFKMGHGFRCKCSLKRHLHLRLDFARSTMDMALEP